MSNGTAKLVGLGDPVKDKEIPCTGMIKIGRVQMRGHTGIF